MPATLETLLEIPAGFASPTVARCLAEMDDQSRRLIEATPTKVALRLSDADLARRVTRQRPDGTTRVFSVDWMLYHLLEHQAGHFGQILLLRHLHRVRTAA